MAITKDLGMVTAYAYAVAGGYTGTEAEFQQLLANLAITLDEFENFSVVVNTLPAGSTATASYADGVLTLGIPKGDTGATGPQGPQGVKGDTGATPALSMGTVTTLPAGSDATASFGGTAEAPVLNLGLPEGADGDVAATNIAKAYDATKTYAVGAYVWYTGALYRCTTAITTAEAWTAAHWTQVALADDVNDLKSAFDEYETGEERIDVTWESGSIDNSGVDTPSTTTIRTAGYIDLTKDKVIKIKTNASTSIGWFWYDANREYLSRGSATVNGSYDLSLYATAAYVRVRATTLNRYNVRLIKGSQAVAIENNCAAVMEAHNQIANGLCEFVCDWEPGILNTSTGEEEVNNLHIRTQYINKNDYAIKGYYAPVAASLQVFEYDADKTFIRRKIYNSTGYVDFEYDSNTVYIRMAYLSARVLKVLQFVPFIANSEKQQIIDSMRLNIAEIKNLSEKCVHHDNFSRTETGYNIGKNSEGVLTDNSYDTVTGASSDDGVRVDDGLTIAADNTRTPVFTVRKIAAAHTPNFMVEFNAPASGQDVYIIYKLTDATNFEAINIGYNGTYYSCIQRTIVNASFGVTIDHKNIYNSVGYVIRLYFLSGVIAVYIDDKYCYSFYADAVDSYVYIGSYRGVTAHFDFINVFDLIPPLVQNTAYLTDDNVSTIPDSTLSANTDRYELDGTVTRFSNKSEHFMLYATDEKINNGRRTERSFVALLPKNLRTMHYEFDVLFPESILPDTATGSYADIFFQLHDRQTGVSRGHVPFDLSLVGDEIHLSQYYSSEQASETLTPVVSGLNLGKVLYGEWMHFDIFIHERYEERQQPFMEIKINGNVVYQSRKPNCANDVPGTSAQYGEYKNNFNLISYSDRYFDNFKITY